MELSGGRRRGATRHSAEDQALDQIAKEAEARLAARRQARAEAREIRMREIERSQKEEENTQDKIYDIYTGDVTGVRVRGGGSTGGRSGGGTSYQGSRRSSEDSLEETPASFRDIRHELREVEDKFRKAMIGNAQLDNEKAAAGYQVELYKDSFEELEEAHTQLQREHKEKCRQFDQMKRELLRVEEDLAATRAALAERDTLIQEEGLVIVGGEGSSSETEESDSGVGAERRSRKALVSASMAQLINSVGHGSLDVRLKKLADERSELQDELRHVKLELEEERARGSTPLHSGELADLHREANKQLGDYKFRLQKAEQDVSTLQANVARLESQVVRYKTAAETAEKIEDELKSERRKLQRELRESQSRVEELETAHTHLQRRLDKLKTAKSALLKDL